MNKNILLAFGITFLFLGTCINPSIATDNIKKSFISIYSGKTLFVGGSGEDNYTKIQDAVDNASDGDTVFVYSGIYFENVIVNTSINLIGEDRNTTSIDANFSGDVIYVSANWTNISGFTIKNSGSREDPYFDSGVDIRQSSNTIYNNNISKNRYGIFIDGFFSSSNQNTILDNIISNNYNGIKSFRSHSDNIIRNSIFYNDVGIMHSSKYCNIMYNNISNNKDGVKIFRENNNITGNIISSNNCFGVWAYSNKNSIHNNTISNNEYGIYLTYSFFLPMNFIPSKSNSIFENNISYNDYGIYLDYSLFNLIFKNNFIYNMENAFFTRSILNKWKQNYWNESRILPKLIFGYIGDFKYRWINIDWRPAKKPYSI